MKAFQVFRVLTLVWILGGTAWAQQNYQKSSEHIQSDEKMEKARVCRTILEDLRNKKSKFLSTCKDLGGESTAKKGSEKIADCSALATDCQEVEERLKSFNLSGLTSRLPGLQNSLLGFEGMDGFDEGIEPAEARVCSKYTIDKYEARKKELESEFNRKSDDLDTAKEKKVDSDKEFQKNYAELEKKNQEIQEDYEKEKVKKEKEDQEAEVKRQQDEISLTKTYAEAQSNLIKLRGEKMNLIFEQQGLNDEYKSLILSCKAKAMEMVQKTQRSITTGLGGAGSSGGLKNSFIVGSYRKCLADALKLFNQKVASARAAVEDKTLTIQATEKQMQQMEKLIATQDEQYQQSLKSRQDQKQKDLENYYAKMNQVIVERQRMIRNNEEKRNVIDQKLAKLESIVTRKSNEIKSLVALDPGDRSFSKKDVSEALTSYNEAVSAASTTDCAEVKSFLSKPSGGTD